MVVVVVVGELDENYHLTNDPLLSQHSPCLVLVSIQVDTWARATWIV